MADFCHTSVRQLADFAAPECGARLKFSKKENTLIKIVVGSFGGAGGAAKTVSIMRKIMRVRPFQEFSTPLHLPDQSSTLHR